MPDFIAHPRILVCAGLLCLPVLFPLARYFFGDLGSVRSDAGLDAAAGRLSWLLGRPPEASMLGSRIVGFLGCYVAVAAAVYQLIVHVGRF